MNNERYKAYSFIFESHFRELNDINILKFQVPDGTEVTMSEVWLNALNGTLLQRIIFRKENNYDRIYKINVAVSLVRPSPNPPINKSRDTKTVRTTIIILKTEMNQLVNYRELSPEDTMKYHVSFLYRDRIPVNTRDTVMTLSENLHSLLMTEKFFDIVIKFPDERTLRAHRNILTVRSEYFQRRLVHDNEVKEKGIMFFKEPNFEVMKQILHFLYSGVVKPMKISEMLKLLKAANMLVIDSLKSVLSKEITRVLTTQNASDIYYLGELHHDPDMEAAIRDFIAKNFSRVSESESRIRLKNAELLEVLNGIDSLVGEENGAALENEARENDDGDEMGINSGSKGENSKGSDDDDIENNGAAEEKELADNGASEDEKKENNGAPAVEEMENNGGLEAGARENNSALETTESENHDDLEFENSENGTSKAIELQNGSSEDKPAKPESSEEGTTHEDSKASEKAKEFSEEEGTENKYSESTETEKENEGTENIISESTETESEFSENEGTKNIISEDAETEKESKGTENIISENTETESEFSENEGRENIISEDTEKENKGTENIISGNTETKSEFSEYEGTENIISESTETERENRATKNIISESTETENESSENEGTEKEFSEETERENVTENGNENGTSKDKGTEKGAPEA